MINIKNLSVTFNNKKILDSLSYTFPSHGLYILTGASGSGKSTFIKALNSLIKYDGTIEYDGINLRNINKNNVSIFRLNNIGYLQQDFGLFDNMTVLENVKLVKSTNNDIEIKQYLRKFEIEKLQNKYIKNLSGGEKQRVAIIRSLINNPKYIFADEPTGALDKYNSEQIMDFLSEISAKRLVVVVSHDLALANKYADVIINIKDGKIQDSLINKQGQNNQKIKPIKKNNKITGIGWKFLFKYTINKFKEHRFRTSLNISTIVFSLFSLGLSISISNIISCSVKNTYSNLIDENRIVICPSENEYSYNKEAIIKEEVEDLVVNHSDDFIGYGSLYLNNFNNIFKDLNKASLIYGDNKEYVPNISFKNIAEYKWIDDIKGSVFPSKDEQLKDDQIILGLSLNQIKSFCNKLSIKESIESFGAFLSNHEVNLVFELANYEWEYEDEQIFIVKGVTLTNEPCIFHSGHLWNEKVIETQMRFPYKYEFSNYALAPWTLNKVHYLKCKTSIDDVIDKSFYDGSFDPFLLEVAAKKYRSNALDNVKDIKELLVFKRYNNTLIPRYSSFIEQELDNISEPIFCSPGGYANYASILMSGFSCPMYFSSDEDTLIQGVDLIQDSSGNDEISSMNIIQGHFSKSHGTSMTFSLLENKYNLSYDEIYISSGAFKKLFPKQSLTSQHLFIAYLPISNSEYKFVDLTIRGIIDNPNYVIYHNEKWTTSFFQTRLGVSIFDLLVDAISYKTQKNFDFNKNNSALKKAFPKLEMIAPLAEIEASTEEVSFYVALVLTILTILSTVMSILIMLLTHLLYKKEIEKDISNARNIGFSKKECKKFSYASIFISSLAAFLISTVLLFIITLVIASNGFIENISDALFLCINPMPYLLMLMLSFVMFLIPFIKTTISKE